ncbi:MAG: hypothetical protein JW910_06555, partial [Anaerolineae bacterium]|nr:hypothetical protein [Anaerolineae bacterium]
MPRHGRIWSCVLVLLIALVLSGCASAPDVTATPSPTARPTSAAPLALPGSPLLVYTTADDLAAAGLPDFNDFVPAAWTSTLPTEPLYEVRLSGSAAQVEACPAAGGERVRLDVTAALRDRASGQILAHESFRGQEPPPCSADAAATLYGLPDTAPLLAWVAASLTGQEILPDAPLH